jgi:hypothetical protein
MKQLSNRPPGRRDEPPRTDWHTAFAQALQMELYAYHDTLEFYPECQLASEPLRIDCVVIKKAKNVTIKKNIAAVFRDAQKTHANR